ncbi:uncharacterized protein LOC142331035 isoform X2 [Lycorma delicatula]|uniref:uncharacterized protein LOC142331035 isoform X2 n=1 Tax=Lycorma delicatula TaxID=130591 RepID=UPI003F519A85
MNIMNYSPSGRTIICKEVFDENSLPSEEEVLDYAQRIGINPDTERHLLSIARDGLMQALPPGWKPVYDDKIKRYYYYNFNNGLTRWDHPLDDHYKELVKKKRAEGCCSAGEDDSKTSIREDLKSYEEQVDISEKMSSSQSQTSQRFNSPNKQFGLVGSGLTAGSRGSGTLSGRPPLPPRRGRSRGNTPPGGSTSPLRHQSPSPGPGRPRGLRLSPSTRDTGQLVHSPSPTRIDIDSMAPLSFNVDPDKSPLDKLQRPITTAPGLTLSGGGSVFLKSKQKSGSLVTSSQVYPKVIPRIIEQKKPSVESIAKSLDDDGDEEEEEEEEIFIGDSNAKHKDISSDFSSLPCNLFTSKRFENVHDFESLQSALEDSASQYNHAVKSNEQTPSQDAHPLKGILRDSSLCSSPTNRGLWDVDPESLTEEKAQLRNQELEEEKKRSVRFADFEKQPLDIRFELPDSEQTPSTSSEDKGNWDSDSDDHDYVDDEKLNAGSSLDISPEQNQPSSKTSEEALLDKFETKTKLSNTGKDCLKVYPTDKIIKKTNWLEENNKKDKIEPNIKEETQLMNRLVQLKKSEIDADEYVNDLLNETKTIGENLNIVDESDNNNYYKTDDLWHIDSDVNSSGINKQNSDPNKNNSVEIKSNSFSCDNDINKTPDSEIISVKDYTMSDMMTDNYKKLTSTNKQIKSSTCGKVVKSTIDYLLKDIKTQSQTPNINETKKEMAILNKSDKSLNINQTKKKELLLIDNEKLFNKKRFQNKSINEEYKTHYLIDEEMFDKRGSSDEVVYSKRSGDFISKGNISLENSDLSLSNDEQVNEKCSNEFLIDIKNTKESNNSKLSNNRANKKINENNKYSDLSNDDHNEDTNIINEKSKDLKENRDVLKIDLQLGIENKSVTKEDSGNSVSPLEDTVSNEELSSSTSFKIKSNQKHQYTDERAFDANAGSFDNYDIKDIALVQKVEDLLEQFQGKLSKDVHEKILQLEKEQMDKLEAAKAEFENKASLEREKLEKEMIDRLTSLKKLLQEEELKKEKEMREETELSLQELRRKIKEENDEKIKQLNEEQKKFLDKQEELSKIERDKIQEETNNRIQMSVHILAKFVEEMKQREEKEIERLKRENDEKLENIRKEYQLKEEEFAEKMKREMEVVENELEDQLNQLKEKSRKKIEEEEEKEMENARKEFIEKKEAEWRKQQEELLNTTDEHRARMEVLREECKQEEEMLKKKHAEKIDSLTAQINRTLEKDSIDITQLTRDFEKVRCEKRLLEDKYQILKEKYIRLKSDVRLSLERKRQAKLNRRNREQTNNVTEETDRSTSHSKTEPQIRNISPRKKYASTDEEGGENMTPKTIKRRPKQSPSIVNSSSTGESCQGDNNNFPVKNETSIQKPKNVCDPSPLRERREGMDTEISSADEFSFASFPNEHVKGGVLKIINQDPMKNHNEENNPLENLKRQLEKLDELEEQFPLSSVTDTYLRYPFSGPAGSSCELEFYRHRLHLERESVRRAKQALSEQRNLLESKQIQLRHKQTSSTLQQLQQEEKELTDMEVHLHRTKALLGEKIIRLKHLELSLEQLSPTPTHFSPSNSLSEPSHSSGFSGSDVDSAAYAKINSRPQRYWTDASFNVLQSLENINCEIREIWTILGKQQIPELSPPPPLQLYDYHPTDSSKMITDQYYIRAQTADIADRTRGLRDWLTKTSKPHVPTTH